MQKGAVLSNYVNGPLFSKKKGGNFWQTEKILIYQDMICFLVLVAFTALICYLIFIKTFMRNCWLMLRWINNAVSNTAARYSRIARYKMVDCEHLWPSGTQHSVKWRKTSKARQVENQNLGPYLKRVLFKCIKYYRCTAVRAVWLTGKKYKECVRKYSFNKSKKTPIV